jgi:hypothetical protein
VQRSQVSNPKPLVIIMAEAAKAYHTACSTACSLAAFIRQHRITLSAACGQAYGELLTL